MSAALHAELELLVRSAGRDHVRAKSQRDFDGGQPGPAGRAQDQHRLSGLQAPAILQPMQSRAVGDGNRGGGFIGNAVRQGDHGSGGGKHFLAAAIIADVSEHALANGETFHARPDAGDRARHLAAGRKWQLRPVLVLAVQHQRVRKS